MFVQSEQTTMQQTILYILGPGALGYMFPKYWVTKRMQTRQEALTNGFPDALDMMLVCVEAGQSMEQSIIRVGKEVRPSCADLADELGYRRQRNEGRQRQIHRSQRHVRALRVTRYLELRDGDEPVSGLRYADV